MHVRDPCRFWSRYTDTDSRNIYYVQAHVGWRPNSFECTWFAPARAATWCRCESGSPKEGTLLCYELHGYSLFYWLLVMSTVELFNQSEVLALVFFIFTFQHSFYNQWIFYNWHQINMKFCMNTTSVWVKQLRFLILHCCWLEHGTLFLRMNRLLIRSVETAPNYK